MFWNHSGNTYGNICERVLWLATFQQNTHRQLLLSHCLLKHCWSGHLFIFCCKVFELTRKIQSSPNELHIKTYSEPSQTSTMWLFMSRINGFQPFISSVKYSILDVWVGSDYASDIPVRKLPTNSLIYLVSISISKSIVICEEMMVAYLIITSWQFMIR